MPRKKLTACCLDCGVDTLKNHEFYMVNPDIWLKAVPDEDHTMTMYLCIRCLETRIGRQLTPTDFTDAPINWPMFSRRSKLLLDRIGQKK